jgi:hypothetical protein
MGLWSPLWGSLEARLSHFVFLVFLVSLVFLVFLVFQPEAEAGAVEPTLGQLGGQAATTP